MRVDRRLYSESRQEVVQTGSCTMRVDRRLYRQEVVHNESRQEVVQ